MMKDLAERAGKLHADLSQKYEDLGDVLNANYHFVQAHNYTEMVKAMEAKKDKSAIAPVS